MNGTTAVRKKKKHPAGKRGEEATSAGDGRTVVPLHAVLVQIRGWAVTRRHHYDAEPKHLLEEGGVEEFA